MREFISTLSNAYTLVAGPATVAMALSLYSEWGRRMWSNRILPTLVCIVMALLILADLYQRGAFDRWMGDQLEIVSDKTFTNTTILLDGHDYRHCTFNNVTFEYGGRPFGLSNSFISGAHFSSTNPDIDQTFLFLAKLGVLKLPVWDKERKLIEPGAKWE
jgi:hypothetical protein